MVAESLLHLVPLVVGSIVEFASGRFVAVPIAVLVMLCLIALGLVTGLVTGDASNGGDCTARELRSVAVLLGLFPAVGALFGVCMGNGRRRWRPSSAELACDRVGEALSYDPSRDFARRRGESH